MTAKELPFEQEKPKTIPQRIMEYLSQQTTPKAVHEMPYLGTNENTISTRLTELARIGKVRGETRPGKKFKEWGLPEIFFNDRNLISQQKVEM